MKLGITSSHVVHAQIDRGCILPPPPDDADAAYLATIVFPRAETPSPTWAAILATATETVRPPARR